MSSRTEFELWATRARSKPMDIKMGSYEGSSTGADFYLDLVTDACWQAWKQAEKTGYEDGYTAAINFIAGG